MKSGKITIRPSKKRKGKYGCSITLTSKTEQNLGAFFKEFLEIEIMQGERIVNTQTGEVVYNLNIPDEKQKIITEAFNKIMFPDEPNQN